jgi:electron transport complex protein RnfE
VLARAEAFASRQPVGRALLDGFAMGGGFLVVLVALGSVREALGRGSLGGDLHLLLGIDASTYGLRLFSEQHGFLLALLPPGAFILLGLGLAWRQARRAGASASTMSTTVIGSKTGGITS